MNTQGCPEPDVLSNWVLGDLPDDQAESVIDHLETCTSCERTVQELDRSTVLGKAGSSAASDFAQDAHCLAIVDTLHDRSSLTRDTGEPFNGLQLAGIRIRDYELLECLGQGGMGTVYKARHTRLNKNVAIKLLTSRREGDPNAIARFEREMHAIGQLDHPNVVSAVDAGEVDGMYFLAMELVDGLDLGQVTSGKRRLEIADACEIIRQTSLGLQYAHSQGLVHRDIKPANLMLALNQDRQPTVKILDLGLAMIPRLLMGEELTDDGQLMGTLEYMAPEQAENTYTVDQCADVYSLGATLFRLLAGSVPFDGPQFKTPVQRLRGLTNSKAPSIAERRVDLPGELIRLVDLMLAREPSDRPCDMAEVVSLLTGFAANHRINQLIERGKTELQRSSGGTPPWEINATQAASAMVVHTLIDEQDSIQTASDAVSDPKRFRWITLGLLICGVLIAISVKLQTDHDTPASGTNNDSMHVAGDAMSDGANPPVVPVTQPIVSMAERTLPDITKMPMGKIHVWGTVAARDETVPIEIGKAEKIDDFVEVQLNGNIGWFGLRANGDVWQWTARDGASIYREGLDVCELNRTAGKSFGHWLNKRGELVERGQADPRLIENAPTSGIVGLARTYPAYNWTILAADGRLHSIGESKSSTPTEIADFVRVGNLRDHFVGIRQTGEFVVWGDERPQLPDLSELRFAKIRSHEFDSLLLTTDGKLVHLTDHQRLKVPEEFERGRWFDISCDPYLYAARRPDGHWRAWGPLERPDDAIKVIHSLGPNVPSIAISLSTIVWIEAQ